jgi:hypothetical protein
MLLAGLASGDKRALCKTLPAGDVAEQIDRLVHPPAAGSTEATRTSGELWARELTSRRSLRLESSKYPGHFYYADISGGTVGSIVWEAEWTPDPFAAEESARLTASAYDTSDV